MSQPKNLRISYILPDFDENAYSGGLYVIFEHINDLIKRGHAIRAFNDVGKKSRYLRLDCDVERHKYNPEIVEDNSPHIIVGTHWRTYFFINMMKTALKNNTKLVFLMQSDDRFLVNSEERELVIKAITGKYKNIIPIYKIAVSKYLQNVVEDYFGQDCSYVRNGFEAKEVPPLLDKTEKTRIVARYDTSEYRGWNLVDSILKRIAKGRSAIEIHLFEMKDKRPAAYKSYFHKGLFGERLLGLFKSCDIYLSGSLYEGFSYPMIEAMSQGCCVCCTDAGGNKEFCIDGETALLSARNDEEGMYRNVLRLMNDKDLMNRLRENGIKKTKEFKWAESLDELERFFTLIPTKVYDTNLLESIKTDDHTVCGKGRIFFVYKKDPFVEYRDWIKVDEVVKYLRSSGLGVEALLFIDRHTAKAVKARLKMLVPRDDFSIFNCKIFYNKKVKLRLPLFNDLFFIAYIIFKTLLNAFSKKGRYAELVFAEGQSHILKFLCRSLKISLHNLDFNDDRLRPYSFGAYAKEYPKKELDYRKLIAEIIRSSLRLGNHLTN